MKTPATIAQALMERHAVIAGHDPEGVACEVQGPGRHRTLAIIASWGEGWDHVSVHARDYLAHCKDVPTWKEMCYVKDLFFGPEECVVQFHPPASQYVNVDPHVLHLWRQHGATSALPPKELI